MTTEAKIEADHIARRSYATDLVAAIGELSNVAKTASNPYFKSKYAPLDAIVDATRPILAKHGLAIQQQPLFSDGAAGVETIIIHKSGFETSSILLLPLKDQSPQGVGSAITYARRYALAAVLGLATEEDDDGNVGTGLSKDERIKANIESSRPAVAKAMDKNPSVRPAATITATWRNVLPTSAKVAAQSKDGSARKWTLYCVEFNDAGKIIEAFTFDKGLNDSAENFGKEGVLVNAGVCPNKKDPSKWELVSITQSEEQA
jgi:hypothetical protein